MMVMDELQNIPKDWDLKPFKSVITFGKGLSITKENLSESGVQCLNYGEIHSKFPFEVLPFTDTLPFVSPDYLATDAKALAQPGDIVFADTSEDIAGAGNFTQIMGSKPIFAGYHTVITRPNASVNSRYLAYVLESEEFRNQIRSKVKGVKVYSITKNILGNTRVWLPDLDTQNTIATYLDDQTRKITTLIREKQNFIDLLKEKRQALISHYVTKGLDANVPMKESGIEWIGMVPKHWSLKAIKHIKAKSRNAFVDGPFGSNLKSEHFIDNGDVYVIESNFATQGELRFDKLKTISNEHFETISRSETAEGAIIIAKIGAQYGKCSILPAIDKPAVVSGNSLSLKVNKEICAVKFVDLALTHLKNRGAMELIVNLTAQPALSLGGLNNLVLPVPPLNEQLRILDTLDDKDTKLSQLISETDISIELLKEQRTALISAAVTGTIDVRKYNKTEAV